MAADEIGLYSINGCRNAQNEPQETSNFIENQVERYVDDVIFFDRD